METAEETNGINKEKKTNVKRVIYEKYILRMERIL